MWVFSFFLLIVWRTGNSFSNVCKKILHFLFIFETQEWKFTTEVGESLRLRLTKKMFFLHPTQLFSIYYFGFFVLLLWTARNCCLSGIKTMLKYLMNFLRAEEKKKNFCWRCERTKMGFWMFPTTLDMGLSRIESFVSCEEVFAKVASEDISWG